MKAYVAIVQRVWVERLRRLAAPREVNLWAPGSRRFRALSVGEPVLFKPHSPAEEIVGGGFFGGASVVPAWLADECFGSGNGAGPEELTALGDRSLSCIVLQDPFFFQREDGLPVPEDFHPNVSHGKLYELDREPGSELWQRVSERFQAAAPPGSEELQPSLFTSPNRVPRPFGPGLFRLVVRELYRDRCALSGEDRTAMLEVVAIRPIDEGGAYRLDNGLLLRSDLATLFRRGYLTVDAEGRAVLSSKLGDAEAGATDVASFGGRALWYPRLRAQRPRAELLAWHRERVFLD